MKGKQKITKADKKFLDYFEGISNMDQCRFLATWFNSKLPEIAKMPENPSRVGIPRGNPIPLPRSKALLALLRMVSPDMELKKYSEFSRASYDVIRQWANQRSFYRFMEKLEREYCQSYCAALKEYIESEVGNPKIREHLQELHYYKNIFIVMEIGGFLRNLAEAAEKTENKNIDYLINLSIAVKSEMLATSESGALLENPELHRKIVLSGFDFQKKHFTDMFDHLTRFINTGDIDIALKLTEILKKEITEGIIPDLTEYAMELYDRNKGKKVKKEK